MKTKSKKKAEPSPIKGTVTYFPNGNDHASRPKDKSMPAVIVSERDHEYQVVSKRNAAGEAIEHKTVTRKLYNLVVFQDSDECTVRRVDVPAKEDMVEGERYFAFPAVAAAVAK